MVAFSDDSAKIWNKNLQIIVNNLPQSGESRIDYWLHCMYIELSRQSGGPVHALTALSNFGGVRLWRAYNVRKVKSCVICCHRVNTIYTITVINFVKTQVLEDLLERNTTLKGLVNEEMQNLSFRVFQALYFAHTSSQRPDIEKIYTSHASTSHSSTPGVICVSRNKTNSEANSTSKRRSSLAIMNFRSKSSLSSQPKPAAQPVAKASTENTLMSAKAFAKFLTQSQGMGGVSSDEVIEMIKKYDLVCDTTNIESISLLGFTHFMLSQEASPLNSNRGVVTQSMNQPLSSYFIASSHNTYLTGHQFNGESSVNMYAMVLASGCRCVELDCWDGDDDDPIIYHGHTFTSKIKFKHVVQTIAEHAFTASPYPLILSLENHCSIPQQVRLAESAILCPLMMFLTQMKMVEYMKRAFGDKLLTDYIDGDMNRQQLPSPQVTVPLYPWLAS